VLGLITLLGFVILLPAMIKQSKTGFSDLLLTLLDSITITIPPSLPAAMNFGISFALDRLR
jgi:magnesium-transporting ATPase (P-type)